MATINQRLRITLTMKGETCDLHTILSDIILTKNGIEAIKKDDYSVHFPFTQIVRYNGNKLSNEKIKEDEARFHKELIKAMDKPPKVQNVVIHSATEDDAAKFRLYKEVCLNPYSTVIQLSEKLEIENEYALNMLLELNKVDRLIAYTFHEDTTDDDKALWYKR